ncbi:MAG: archaellin/type IV pilin N-terminal domain-containing protein [Desulfurococcaceae archaeon]|uniref:Uncharacterized protein n=1 Tax=Staphylothermus marinus TaxID=2280 RepID=A0A7C4JMN4_STAMA
MKAISPIIATLILIAIAVIAGVFVLRQFITLGGTAGRTDVIQIQDGALYLAKKTQVINETYSVVWMEVNLQITLKNTGGRIVTIRDITVDGYKLQGFTTFNINPGETTTKSYPIILNPATGETRILFDANWEKGTSHIVTVTYVVFGTTIEQKVSQTIVVV